PVVASIRACVGVAGVAHIDSADGGSSLAVYPGDRRHGRRVRIAVVSGGGAGIRRDYNCRVSFGDVVGDYGIADVVVVTGAITERPIIIVISAGVGMGRMAQIETAQALCLHTFGSSTGGVRVAVVSHVIRRDRDCGIGFGDVVGDDGIADVLVVSGASEEPIVSSVRAGIGMGCVAHVDETYRRSGLAVDAGDRRHSRAVRIAVVGRG